MSHEAIISTLNPIPKEKASGDRPRDNAYGDRRDRPYDRRPADKGEYKSKQPKGNLAYTTKEAKSRQDKSRQNPNRNSNSHSFTDPLDPRRFPSSFARQDPEPKRALCPLCMKKHHAHLCNTYPGSLIGSASSAKKAYANIAWWPMSRRQAESATAGRKPAGGGSVPRMGTTR